MNGSESGHCGRLFGTIHSSPLFNTVDSHKQLYGVTVCVGHIGIGIELTHAPRFGGNTDDPQLHISLDNIPSSHVFNELSVIILVESHNPDSNTWLSHQQLLVISWSFIQFDMILPFTHTPKPSNNTELPQLHECHKLSISDVLSGHIGRFPFGLHTNPWFPGKIPEHQQS